MSEIAPLVPPDTDFLRTFPYMPLKVAQLRDSDLATLADGEQFRAAVLLWCAAWHQAPAASLPVDDFLLARLAGFGRDVRSWRKVREKALHGFAPRNDGRYYHPVIADLAIEAASKMRCSAERMRNVTEARKRKRANRIDNIALNGTSPPDPQRHVNVTLNGTSHDTLNATSTKGIEEKGIEEKKELQRKDADACVREASKTFGKPIRNGTVPTLENRPSRNS